MAEETGEKLTDPNELMHRQIHPNFIQEGKVSSQAFRPFPRDEGRLSVDRDSVATAQESFILHTEKKNLQSAGTWSVTVEECEEQDLDVLADPIQEEDPANPAHCLVDFRPLSKRQRKKKARRLRDAAEARGPTHQPG